MTTDPTRPALPAPPDPAASPRAPGLPAGVLGIRPGPGANCSSIGSVIDMLFVAGTVGAALTAAIAAALDDAAGAPPAPGAEPEARAAREPADDGR